ncbi:hypothetical protein VNO77_27690 [Canavalia gladiata]|uniref:Uncharacterized protein n=1 Tax=Canavalia gladiata TaxID=3824 RepID=A0AAN9KVR4_CANGL
MFGALRMSSMWLNVNLTTLLLDFGRKMKLKITNLYGSIAVPASASRLDSEIAIRSSALLPSPSSRCDSPKKKI